MTASHVLSIFVEFSQNELGMRQKDIYRIFGRSCNRTQLQQDVTSIIQGLYDNPDFPDTSQSMTFDIWESMSGPDSTAHIRVIIVPRTLKQSKYSYPCYTNYNLKNFSLELMVDMHTNEPRLICYVK